jgi:hypothetical protein
LAKTFCGKNARTFLAMSRRMDCRQSGSSVAALASRR